MMSFKRQLLPPLAKPKSPNADLEELPNVDDLVRRWTNNHNDNLNVGPETHWLSDLQAVVEQPKTIIE